jgi:hypothetical protein
MVPRTTDWLTSCEFLSQEIEGALDLPRGFDGVVLIHAVDLQRLSTRPKYPAPSCVGVERTGRTQFHQL